MTFSARTSQHDAPNPLAEAVRRARRARGRGRPRAARSHRRQPDVRGDPVRHRRRSSPRSPIRAASSTSPSRSASPSAREAVARDWTARGTPIDASRIALTASTSEAYAVLFKVLCDPGDEVLVPAPSYPLLGFLAAFESVTLKTYPLVYAGGWHVDLDALKRAIGPRTKAIVVVTPEQPDRLVPRRARARGDARPRAADRERRGLRDVSARAASGAPEGRDRERRDGVARPRLRALRPLEARGPAADEARMDRRLRRGVARRAGDGEARARARRVPLRRDARAARAARRSSRRAARPSTRSARARARTSTCSAPR